MFSCVYLINVHSLQNPNEASQQKCTFRVMSFNVLAQGLSSDSFVRCPPEALQFDRRLGEIVAELTRYSADVICLQEVDMFEQMKKKLSDYKGLWVPKPTSPCLMSDDNIGPDGSAIFYKPSTVQLLAHHSEVIEVDGKATGQVLLAAHLKLSTDIKLLVVCVHLKAKSPHSKLREKQGRAILKYIENNSGECDTVIVAGDLNSDPSEPVHTLLESSGFICSYSSAVGCRSEYTTCKIRMVDGVETLQKKTEDYIYYRNLKKKNQFSVARVLQIPNETSLGEGRLPNMDYPSDHLSMVTDFAIP
ncbi:hypothetical protein EB796_000658 [Bugula neritina]|uniref:Nocturnin n=1 Tax=Bugula neritina TaxID=10212 RepID=A0A7J7KSB5_BUGNE|nr:hypothetical protein EB796_000658 [Bugula neritina]